jgi:hypothetical protein
MCTFSGTNETIMAGLCGEEYCSCSEIMTASLFLELRKALKFTLAVISGFFLVVLGLLYHFNSH